MHVITKVFSKHYASTMYVQDLEYYRTLAKEGPWVVHLTLGQDWRMGQYSRYQCRI